MHGAGVFYCIFVLRNYASNNTHIALYISQTWSLQQTQNTSYLIKRDKI